MEKEREREKGSEGKIKREKWKKIGRGKEKGSESKKSDRNVVTKH